ncbi:unconventional myosin-XVIIIb-like [Physeter macrocephalus]|uniref:Unconventional myosin-XVIIIb-like n=1 Tax=Physeter macrocephalus TaxID=9755 RepID=A0A455B300_PHYMC|nr:unconventional myosin-XVIIIb-like [Physeter catodon]|eukprot:XP_028342909.1 unconventional myosin-XVIIIb-like [Physeter catodon]
MVWVTLTHCPCRPQLRQRFELEVERMKQMHEKDREDKEEEMEDIRQSCQRRLRQLEMQLEQEYEEKQMVLHEKQDLEGLIGTLCDQIGHRDFDVEKRLRRDLRRTHALLSDVKLLLGTTEDSKRSVSREELEKVQSQVGVTGSSQNPMGRMLRPAGGERFSHPDGRGHSPHVWLPQTCGEVEGIAGLDGSHGYGG